jgi:membrane-bound lytic murein transglycosylase D
VIVKKQVKFSQISGVCSNITVEDLRTLNPHYRRDIIPANYSLRLPSQNITEFIELEDSIYASAPTAPVSPVVAKQKPKAASSAASGRRTVTVKSGESLSVIAKRNGTTVAKIRKLNGLKGNMIRPGQKLRVR